MKKTLAAILIAVIAISAFTLVASVNAKPFMKWREFKNIPGTSNRPIQQSYTRIDAVVTQWNITDIVGSNTTVDVKGTLQAQSRTKTFNLDGLRQGASASAIWTTNLTAPISAVKEVKNITYTFYTAKISEVNTSALNFESNDFFLNATWTVYNVTASVNVTTNSAGDIISVSRNQNAVALSTNVIGILNVTGGWSKFTLNITNAGQLSGMVYRQRTSSTQFNAFKVDDDGNNVVTKIDMKTIAEAYGAAPGWGKYDQRMDYNFNYKIDITDLSTAAANLNQQ
jgi:hypothetical protein